MEVRFRVRFGLRAYWQGSPIGLRLPRAGRAHRWRHPARCLIRGFSREPAPAAHGPLSLSDGSSLSSCDWIYSARSRDRLSLKSRGSGWARVASGSTCRHTWLAEVWVAICCSHIPLHATEPVVRWRTACRARPEQEFHGQFLFPQPVVHEIAERRLPPDPRFRASGHTNKDRCRRRRLVTRGRLTRGHV